MASRRQMSWLGYQWAVLAMALRETRAFFHGERWKTTLLVSLLSIFLGGYFAFLWMETKAAEVQVRNMLVVLAGLLGGLLGPILFNWIFRAPWLLYRQAERERVRDEVGAQTFTP